MTLSLALTFWKVMDNKRNPYIRQAVSKFSLMNLKALLKESVGFKTFAFLNVNLDIAH